MSFNIDTFKTHFEELGFLQTNKFEVTVSPPKIFSNRRLINNQSEISISSISDALRFRIEAVRAPGIQILFDDNTRYGIGPTQKQPFNAQLNEISINFIVDYDSILWQFWHNWINNIFQHSGTNNSYPTYLAKYKDDFSTIIDIDIYTNDGNLSQTIELYQAFPTAISEVPLTWGDQNNPLRMSVTLSFSEYQILGSGLT
jgi:hypothetical protein